MKLNCETTEVTLITIAGRRVVFLEGICASMPSRSLGMDAFLACADTLALEK